MKKRTYNRIVKEGSKLYVVNEEGVTRRASSYVNNIYKDVLKLRKQILQRIERIDKAKTRNYLKERYYEKDLGNLKGLSVQELINRKRDYKYQLGLTSSTIKGSRKVTEIYTKINDNLDEATMSDFWSTYRKFEEMRGDLIISWGSDEVISEMIDIYQEGGNTLSKTLYRFEEKEFYKHSRNSFFFTDSVSSFEKEVNNYEGFKRANKRYGRRFVKAKKRI